VDVNLWIALPVSRVPCPTEKEQGRVVLLVVLVGVANMSETCRDTGWLLLREAESRQRK
jgi:hypothetical protein